MPATDRHQRHLPPVVAGDAGAAAARPGEPPAGARPAAAAVGRDDPRPGAGGQRAAGREARRPVGAAVSAGRAVEGAGRDAAATTSRTTAPDLYRRSLYTFWKRTVAAAGDDDLRRRRPRDLRRPRDAHQHAAAGAEPDERRDLRRSGARAGRADHEAKAERRPKSA